MANLKVLTSDPDVDAALERMKASGSEEARAVSAGYHPALDVFVLRMSNGERYVLQRELLQGLEGASKRELRKVELIGNGSGLSWPELDVDLFIPALVRGIFGSKRWMAEIGRRGGSSRSGAKKKASRANGAKGGRPKRGLV